MDKIKYKKILFISGLDIWSMGQQKGAPSLSNTLRGYAEDGWCVFFITGNENVKSIDNIHENVKIYRFDAKWAKLNRYFMKSIWWLYFQIVAFFIGLKVCLREEIDMFYGYEVTGVPVAKLLSILFHKPFISRFQGTKTYFHLKDHFWRFRHWDEVLSMKIKSDLVIMTNDGTQGDLMLNIIGKDMSKVKFWMNGVENFLDVNFNKKEFKKSIGIDPGEKILLSVSRLEKWKRVDRTIVAVSDIIKNHRQLKIRLIIIGDGEEKRNLEEMVRNLKIDDYVTFTGALAHAELKNYYNAADIFISLYDISNVGNPLLEAMKCSKCVIALQGGDTDKLIQNDDTGILLKYSELRELPSIIIRLLENSKDMQRLGNKAKIYADKYFWTWQERIRAELVNVNRLLHT
ncbi:MAG: glycosyltransferase family 4 protein [Deltaproteobacteria bacterium]|nr:glycosyltransferase family 4 protein [Deltaproteobacteria bacterium]